MRGTTVVNIIICEDNHIQRKNLEKIIQEQIIDLSIDMKIALSTDKSLEVIKYLDNNKNENNIYFLDIELESDKSGLELGKKIREKDMKGHIIFISSHVEMPILTFEYKVQALGFIFKSDINLRKKIRENMVAAYDIYNKNQIEEKNKITIDSGGKLYLLDFHEILFFETTGKNHKIRVHALDKQIEFYGTMKEIKKQVSADFYKAHKSYLVNTNNIKEVDKKSLLVKMINEEEFYASRNYVKGLINICIA